MDFAFDARTEELRGRLLAFMDEVIYPAEPVFSAQVAEAAARGVIWARPPVMEEVKTQARARGLWNLFLRPRARAWALRSSMTGGRAQIVPSAAACATCAANTGSAG